MKKKLSILKAKGVPFVSWKLSPDQQDFVTNVLHYPIKPYIFSIKTRRFVNPKGKPAIIKEIHFAKVKYHQPTINRALKSTEQKLLDEDDVDYYPLIFYIFLKK